MSERTLNAVQAALLVVAAFFFGLSAGKWYVEQTNYRAGYAAAVDSVRAAAGAFVDYDTLRVPMRVRFADDTELVDMRLHLWVHRDGTVEVVR